MILHGTGIRVPDPEGEAPSTGFYVTRSVRAASAEAAEGRAREMVLRDWTSGKYATHYEGDPPALSVDSVYASTLLEHLRFKNRGGHAFYPPDSNTA
ncbi:MAG TPA: hypothetical protein VJU77_12765 [Chthoniobacterales bacterium]|nr:hypothetical protein [Chthoniobacterales bacterium]